MLTRFLGRMAELAVDDALRTALSLDWTDTSRQPGLLCYLPFYVGNPFQALLYSRLPEHGFQSAPLYDAGQAAEVVEQLAGAGIELVVHTHWLNSVTNKAEDEAMARLAAKSHVEALERAKALGARMLWTVHNVLPHEVRFTEVDVGLRRDMAALADRIHVMSPRTRELVAPWFDLPEEKILRIPHPSYAGVYPDWMPRAQARAGLGIPQDATVLLMLGAIRAYKGLTELMDAFDELSRREPGRFVLLVAGQPDDDAESLRFVQRASVHPAVFGAFRRITDQQMQVYLNAADVGVFPYRRSLNSGALTLGLTFGLPAVLPKQSGEGPAVDSSFAEIYDAADPDGLLNALSAARRLATTEARAAAKVSVKPIEPAVVAKTFGEELRAWVDAPPE